MNNLLSKSLDSRKIASLQQETVFTAEVVGLGPTSTLLLFLGPLLLTGKSGSWFSKEPAK